MKNRYPIPDAAMDDRLAIVGTSGSGKTYTVLGAIPRLLARRSRVIAIDPLGVMWGLRLRANGKTPSSYKIVIFGGSHGDLPLNEHAGALVGEAAATMRESCIIDLSQIGTKAGERRFMLAFLTALYKHASRQPVHLVIDEADMFAPQKLLDKDGEAAKLLGMMETVVRRGRVKGFVPWLLSQRPAVLSKDVLSQADGLVALKLTAKQDRTAIGGWIEGQADGETGKAILGALPAMQRGDAVVWVPGRGILAPVSFPKNETFDSSATPKAGKRLNSGKLKPLNLGALKEKLATVEAEAKENDPRLLKAEVARLRSELARKTRAVPAPVVKDRYPVGFADGQKQGLKDGYGQGVAKALDAVKRIAHGNAIANKPDLPTARKAVEAYRKKHPEITQTFKAASAGKSKPILLSLHSSGKSAQSVNLPTGERAILIAALQYDPVDKDQLSVLTGYKRSSRDAYIARLREKGLVAMDGSKIRPSALAAEALGDYEPLPTGDALRAYWMRRLPTGEAKILEVLVGDYPSGVTRETIDRETAYKRSSRDAYIARLVAKRLVTVDRSEVTASENLFD